MSLCAALLLCLPKAELAEPPMSALQAVEVDTMEGELSGFSVWKTDKLFWLAAGQATREQVRAFMLEEEDLPFYADAVRIKGVIVSNSPARLIKRGEILDLRLRPSPLNGFRWLGPVVVSKRRPRR